MYTKIIININGKEIEFKAHEIVMIARSTVESFSLPENMDQQLRIYTPDEYNQLIRYAASLGNDMDIISGSIDACLAVPMHIQGIDSALKWLYLSRTLYKRHQEELETHKLLSVYEDKTNPSDKKVIKIIAESANDYIICIDEFGRTMELRGKADIKLNSVIEGTWVKIAGRLILVKNTAQMTFYVSDHGCLDQIIEKVRELAFGFDWTNSKLASMLVSIYRELESMTTDERIEFESKFINSIKNEDIEVFRFFYPGYSDAEIEEVKIKAVSNPASLLLDTVESNRFIIHSLIKKYMQMKFFDQKFKDFDNEIYRNFYVYDEDGEPIIEDMNIEGVIKTFQDRWHDASELIKRIVVQTIASDINRGVHEPLFRPISSYGDRNKGSSYHVFENSVIEYLLQEEHFSNAEIARMMRVVLRGEVPDLRGANFIPNLVAAWFIAEPTRNPTSLLSGLMLLDMMENNIELIDDEGNNWYNLRNTLIHPLKSKGFGKVRDLYGSNGGIDRFGGAHPMAHDGSVADSKEIRQDSKLTAVHQKEASLIFHWLSLYLENKGIKCRLVSDTEEKLQQSGIDLSSVSTNFKDSERLKWLRKEIKSLQGTIRVKNNEGKDSNKESKRLAKFQEEEAELLLKQMVEMKFIIPALYERLETLGNLLLSLHSRERVYINISPSYEADELKTAISYALQEAYPNQEIFEILPIDPDGNCMYNSIREGLIRLPTNYVGNRFITLESLREDVANEIELAEDTDRFIEYAQDIRTQLFTYIIEGDVVGFNTEVGNRISTLGNFYLQLINSGYTVNDAQEHITQAIDDSHLVDAYIDMIRENNSWGGNVELRIMAENLGVQFIVHRRDEVNIRINENSILPIIHLDYNGGHYNLITNLAHYDQVQISNRITTTVVTGLLCIDALMDPEYVMLNDKVFQDFGVTLVATSKEFSRSYTKLLALEDKQTTSRDIDLSLIGLSAQQIIRFEPTVRYFLKIMNVEIPKFEVSNEVRASLDFAFGVVKINLDNSLVLGQVFESGFYYSTIKVYELMHTHNINEQPKDLVTFTKACSIDIIFGGLLGLSSASPVYGTISGYSICLNKYQLFKDESSAQTIFRYGADFASGILTIMALSKHNPVFILIGVMNTVVMTDITVKVGCTMGDLVLNGINSEFNTNDYTEI